MDYSLLLAVHNITEETKPTQDLSLVSSSETTTENESISSNATNNKVSSTNEEIQRDTNISITKLSSLPTYIQYLRVIEFIRAQQEPSVLDTKNILSDTHIDNLDTASIITVKPESSPVLNKHTEKMSQSNEESLNSTNVLLRTNSKSPTNHQNTSSSPFHLANGLIGGDVWYHRQNLSRLAMYVYFN